LPIDCWRFRAGCEWIVDQPNDGYDQDDRRENGDRECRVDAQQHRDGEAADDQCPTGSSVQLRPIPHGLNIISKA